MIAEIKTGRLETVVIVLLVLAILFQIPGYGGTCTMGSTDELLGGAILSFLPTLGSFLILIKLTKKEKQTRPRIGLALIVILGLALSMCLAASPMAYNTLLEFGSACGPEFDGPEYATFSENISLLSRLMRRDTFIGIIYCVLPFLCFVVAANLARRRRFSDI